MDHRHFIASLPPAETGALTQRADAPGLAHLAGHLGLILACGAGIAMQVPLWPLLLPVQGVLIIFLFTLEHECTHKTPFATPWLSEAVGHLCGVLILLPFTWFRYFHLAHHRHTNDPERDPELAGGGPPETLPALVWHVTGWRYWKTVVQTLLGNALGRFDAPYLPRSAHARMRAEAQLYLLGYALVAVALTVSPLLFWVWLLPVLLGQPFLRLYLLAEHSRCPQVADMLDNTRTTFTNRAVRFVAWNMPYHAEHHAMPQVPFHKLPALHRHMAPHLKQTAPGYAAHTRDFAAGLSETPAG